jgi:hypothetical protein
VRPAALIDVDGVLNRWLLTQAEPGWVRHEASPGESGTTFTLYLNPDHGKLLAAFAEQTNTELIWGTTWESDANTCIGPHVGLPELPVAPLPPFHGLDAESFRWKADGFIPWLAGRPFVWFEDDPGEKRRADKLAEQPHLVVLVDPAEGLQQHHLDEAARWLAGYWRGEAAAARGES